MYDVLISTHCAKEWGSHPDPVTSLLEYRPFLTRGDLKTMASVPLYATAAKSWAELSAAGVFVCNVTSVEHTPSAKQRIQTLNLHPGKRSSGSPTAKDMCTRAKHPKEPRQQPTMSTQVHRSDIPSGCDPAIKVGHMSVVMLAMLAFCFLGMQDMVGLRPQPFPP